MKMKALTLHWLLLVLALVGTTFVSSAFAQDDGMQFADESYDEEQEASGDEAKSETSWDNDKSGEAQEEEDEEDDEF
jgi:hypothetical protein